MDAKLAPYDVMKVREDFPILREKPYGKPLVYLDNGASAQKPKQVIESPDLRLRTRIRELCIAGCIISPMRQRIL